MEVTNERTRRHSRLPPPAWHATKPSMPRPTPTRRRHHSASPAAPAMVRARPTRLMQFTHGNEHNNLRPPAPAGGRCEVRKVGPA
jgi:hypothetical protein